ncbi:MAG TPA: hypothetical protein VIT45_17080 [Allosphingosinicella sp.]
MHLLEGTSPKQAAALWTLGLLNADDIGILAASWLERGEDGGSTALAEIALNRPASLSEAGPAFETALAEMGVSLPALEEPVLVALELYLRAIIEGRVLPMKGMKALDELDDRRGGVVFRHPAHDPDGPQNYAGAELGLEHLHTWYREYSDAADGSTWYYNELPIEEQLARFDEELIAEALVLHRHLCAVHPELCGDGEPRVGAYKDRLEKATFPAIDRRSGMKHRKGRSWTDSGALLTLAWLFLGPVLFFFWQRSEKPEMAAASMSSAAIEAALLVALIFWVLAGIAYGLVRWIVTGRGPQA